MIKPAYLMVFALFPVLISCHRKTETFEERLARRVEERVTDAIDLSEEERERISELFRHAATQLDSLNLDSLKLDSFRLADVDLIGFRELRKVLPQQILGMQRDDLGGETRNFLGIQFSTAKSLFEDNNRRVRVEITDSGTASSLVGRLASQNAFSVDKEGENYSQRTFELDGHPAYERYSTSGEPESSLTVLVNDRFLIRLNGENVTPEQLLEVYRAIKTSALPEVD